MLFWAVDIVFPILMVLTMTILFWQYRKVNQNFYRVNSTGYPGNSNVNLKTKSKEGVVLEQNLLGLSYFLIIISAIIVVFILMNLLASSNVYHVFSQANLSPAQNLEASLFLMNFYIVFLIASAVYYRLLVKFRVNSEEVVRLSRVLFVLTLLNRSFIFIIVLFLVVLSANFLVSII